MRRVHKLPVKTEPVLHVHKYIVVIYAGRRKKFRYCVNLKEVREQARLMKKFARHGTIMEVYKATHDFRAAFVVK